VAGRRAVPVMSRAMVPAGAKAPLEYLSALAVCGVVIVVTFFVEPPLTRWIVFAVGVAMAVSVAAAALRPVRR